MSNELHINFENGSWCNAVLSINTMGPDVAVRSTGVPSANQWLCPSCFIIVAIAVAMMQ
jgi:hypothetical protein